MSTVLIVIHLMVVLALIGLVLLQRSEGGALGIGGSGGVMSGRGAGNVLTRATGVLAAVFFLTSVGLTLLARLDAGSSGILDRLPAGTAASDSPAQTPAPIGTPENAQDLLRSLGGPQAPPGDPVPPAPGPAAEAPAPPPPAGSAPIVPATVPPAAPQPAPAVPPPAAPATAP